MIRSTKVTLKYANQNKKETLAAILNEYNKLAQFFVDYLWENYPISTKIPTLLPKNITEKAKTWLSKRMVQCCGKQASGIVRGCRKKHEKRIYVYNKLKEKNQNKQAKKLAHFIKINPISKPQLNSIQAELDSRFVEIEYNNKTSFDGWVNLGSIGNKLKLKIPIKSHIHLNQLKQQGKQLTGIRMSQHAATFMFELPEKSKITGKTVGIDIGIKSAFTCSDTNNNEDDCNGHTIETVCKKLARKKKGSKAFIKATKHRRNLIGYYKNKLDWMNIKTIKIEKIVKLRYKTKCSRYLSHFVYHEFFESLKKTAEQQGVLVEEVCPTYTSQRCSCCGWTRKRNRNGKRFNCGNCGYTTDADFNASVNISLDLIPIRKSERHKRLNLAGFFWPVETLSGKEFIVSSVQKT
jgi:hypothetical protein